MIGESSLDTVGLRTFEGGVESLKSVRQKKNKKIPKCVVGGGVTIYGKLPKKRALPVKQPDEIYQKYHNSAH